MVMSIQYLVFAALLVACIHAAERSIPDKVPAVSTEIRQKRSNLWEPGYRFTSPKEEQLALDGPSVDPALHGMRLLDTVLLASVDGKLHGVNRTTGHLLWSMSNDPHTDAPLTFSSLVRTQHSAHDPEREFFIIEPQSGDIYILPPMASPSDTLQRLPLSIQQIVEMSPFSFPGEENRVFVGSKETSMIILELETGRVKGTINTDKECFWDDQPEDEEDESDLSLPKRALRSPLVHIGRTDYHIRIHSRQHGVLQNLYFSSYGPNNIDREKQSKWKRTPDNLYIQSLPNGQVLAFQTEGPNMLEPIHYDGMPIWGRDFKLPIVAVFDLVNSPSRSNPVALLQPQPRLEQLFPKRSDTSPRAAHMMPQVTYVGLVGDSLYALGHDNFPLVVFDQTPPLSIPEGDSVNNPPCNGVECLVGARKLDSGSQWYPPLLIDPPTPSETELKQPKEQSLVERPEIGVDIPRLEAGINQTIPTLGESPTPGWERDIRTWGVLGFTLLLGMTIAKLFMSNSREISQTNDLPRSVPIEEDHALPPTPPSVIPPVPSEDTSPVPTTPFVDTPAQLNNALPAPNPTEPGLDAEDNEDSDKEVEVNQIRRKGPRRRRRGKKKKSEQTNDNPDLGEAAEPDDFVQVQLPVELSPQPITPKLSPSPLVTPSTALPLQLPPLSPPAIPPSKPIPKVESPSSSSLAVSETVLGFGSHGTVVFEGSLQGRAVAVKRLLQDFVTVATREVELLQESDDHPNVIRYFYKESREGFMYIALELCPASLADIIEKPSSYPAIVKAFDPKRGLWQITSGLRHLHTLKIVHRDIKPHNILVSRPKNGQHRMLISDFGLCKKLDVDQTSFLPTVHGAMAAGTVGWRAPEILRGDVKLDEQTLDPDDLSSQGSTASGRSASSTGVKPARLTKSVDIFALGCLFYYTLTQGGHPFGDRFEREANIMKDRMDLEGLQTFGEEGVEAVHLISSMLAQEPKDRPDTTSILTHPFFWTPGRRLNFLQDASDRFEIMCRDPREAGLIALETNAYDVVGNDWAARLDKVFVENLGKFRKYDGRSVQDLLRALRNKKHHYQDLPDHVKRHLGPLPDGFLSYFTRRFPALFLHVYGVVQRSGLSRESMFRSYFELAET